jgi:hypothetical protein
MYFSRRCLNVFYLSKKELGTKKVMRSGSGLGIYTEREEECDISVRKPRVVSLVTKAKQNK